MPSVATVSPSQLVLDPADRCFPVLTVEWFDGQGVEVDGRQTSDVDVDFVRVTAWNVEWMDATVRTEEVLGLTRIEAIFTQLLPAAHQLKLVRSDDQMQKPFAATHRTVAVENRRIPKCGRDLEGHLAAMTTSRPCLHHASDIQVR